MKKKLIAYVLMVVFCMVATLAVAGDKPSGEEAEIAAFIEKYARAIGEKDLEACMKMYDPGPDTVMMGTGPGERWEGKDEIEMAHAEFFNSFDTETSHATWRQITVAGDTAWGTSMTTVVSYFKNQKNEFFLNNSFVLRKHKGEWRIVLFHFSNLT